MEPAFCGNSSTWTKEPTNNAAGFYSSLRELIENSGCISGSETPNTLTMVSRGNMLTNEVQPLNRMPMTERVVSESGESFEWVFTSAVKTLQQLRLLKPYWVVFMTHRYSELVSPATIKTLEQLRLLRPNCVAPETRRYLESSYPAAIKTLEQLRLLKPNWDSYGAKKPSVHTIERAYGLLLELERAAKDAGTTLPEPEVGPSAKGSIQFEWNIQGKEFELEFLVVNDQTRYDCLLCPSEDEDEWEEEQFTGDLLRHSCIKTFLKWI